MSCNNESLLDVQNISTNTSSSQRHSARNSTHTSKFFFPFRLKDITQEILDAENEPLKEITLNESEESNECFPETQKEIPQIIIDTKFGDLGVKMLETPKKPNVSVAHAKEGVTFFSSTPFPLNCKQMSTPSLGPIGKVNNNLKVPASAHIISQVTPLCIGNEVKVNNRLKHLNKQPHDYKENNPKTQSNDLEQICVNNVNYLILNQLGRGGTSVVYHCYNIVTKEERAIKKVNLESDTQRIGYLNEVNVLGQLQNSDWIIHMYDYQYIESNNTLLLVLEKGEPDLSKILRHSINSKTHLPLYRIICYWLEMLYAVREIHSNGWLLAPFTTLFSCDKFQV
uniref:Protein kinase domain-containing protein n=1 Tax=Photinus pyralis TaxID=7054 RepID=A0A1Y1K4J7_PHOPY